ESDGQRHDRERLVGLGIAVPGRTPIYIPIAHRYLGAPPRMSGETLAPIAEILADPKVEIVCHDAKNMRKLLRRDSIELSSVVLDTLLAGTILDPGTNVSACSVALEHLVGIKLDERETLIGKGKKAVSWEMVDVGHAAGYVGPMACALLAARKRVCESIANAGMESLYRDIELPLAMVLADIEDMGITLDLDLLDRLRDEVSARISAVETRTFELAGGPFNMGSQKQLSILLFDTLGLRSTVMKKTKTGHSTDHEVLEAMISTHEIIPPILEHRELVKLKGTYIDALPPLINPKTKRLHTSFRQDVAATGRLSSQEPNLQNIPIRTEIGRNVRRAFVAAPGCELISADYSQIELRVMAHLSKDPTLVQAFVDGVDVHSQTAAAVFDVQVDEVTPEQRRVAKAVNYGLIYGQSEFGLSRALGIPKGEARQHINRYFERFSKVREYMDEVVESAREAGAAYTVCGRRRPIPGLKSSNFRVRSAAERIAQNTPMQGSAADIMKLAMLAVDGLLRNSDSGAKILLTVHDELVIEVKEELAEELSVQVKESMESAFTLIVPLVVDTGVATSWADAH
ncbi:MAG: DNA polymerase I, partial [Kofleriaceae bacterium]|nr:DNA polymerase I [Kofleriaceae bacterium]